VPLRLFTQHFICLQAALFWGGIIVTYRRLILILTCLGLLLLTSCSAKFQNSSGAKKTTADTFNSATTENPQPQLKRNIDVNSEAATLKSTSGRVALSLIICKMDSSRVFETLSQKDASELLAIISEVAQQKSQTLESLNNQYGLKDILASEKIYVDIRSNAVTSAATQSNSDDSWITKFQAAINTN
jgi:hypothetical protein